MDKKGSCGGGGVCAGLGGTGLPAGATRPVSGGEQSHGVQAEYGAVAETTSVVSLGRGHPSLYRDRGTGRGTGRYLRGSGQIRFALGNQPGNSEGRTGGVEHS